MLRKALPALLGIMMFVGTVLCPAQEKTLLEPAADWTGIPRDAPEKYSHPLFGPVDQCGNVKRQLIVLNPNLVQCEPLHLRLLFYTSDPLARREVLLKRNFGSDIRVNVEPPVGPSYSFTGLGLGNTVPTAALEMKGFSEYRMGFVMAYDSESITGAAFDIPGTYRIEVIINCVTRSGMPNPVRMGVFEINVAEAKGFDRRSLLLLDDPDYYHVFQARSTKLGDRQLVSTEQVRKFRQVINEYKDAAIRPYAMYVLADYYDEHNEQQEALRFLRRLRDEYPGTPLAEDAYVREIGLLSRLDLKEEARRLFVEGWQDSVRTHLFQPESPYWRMFVDDVTSDRAGSQWMIQKKPGKDPEILDGEQLGPKIVVSPEVQQQWGLPAVIRPGSE